MRLRHRIALIAAVTALMAWQAASGDAHSGLRFSSPLDGSTLGDSPQYIHLTFVERPEPALSTIRIVDTTGTTRPTGRPAIADGDPLSLVIPVQPLDRGVYTVHWRVVSAVDGHASSGVFAFGILVSPTAVSDRAAEQSESSLLEAMARTIFLMGVLVAVGACAACAVSGSVPLVAATSGTGAAAAGLALLAFAQMRVAGVGFEQLGTTAIGEALIQRASAVGIMAASLATAWVGRRRRYAGAFAIAILAAASMAAIVAHAAAGHAAAGRWPVTSTVTVQSVHIAAAGVWLGGLAALLFAMRRAGGPDYARAFGRFSIVAGLGLIAIVITGIARSVHEIPRWGDLATQYGAIVAIKGALLLGIAALGARNFFRNVALARVNPSPLRRAAGAELLLAIVATAAAGWLGTLSPPAAASPQAAIEASGTDFGTTVRATLQAMSDQPGPNKFIASVTDYDSREPIAATAIRLRFTSKDDPAVTPTVLDLQASADGTFMASGANVAFPGRWRVNMLVERGTGSVEVPLDLEARGRPHRVSISRRPDRPARYTAEIGTIGFIRIEVDSEQQGPSAIRITTYNVIYEPLPIDHIIVTAGEDAAARELTVTRQDRDRFSTSANFHAGTNRLTVVARDAAGQRLHASFLIDVSTPE